MSQAAPPHPPDALSVARATLDDLRAESTALSSQLNSLNYANELTSAELSRRGASLSPTACLTTPPAPPSSSPQALESALLASKSSSTAARQRIHSLRAEIAALRDRVASHHVLAATDALSAPPRRRGSAARTIAQLDAFVRLDADAPLLPCHAVVSAAGKIAVAPVRHTKALVELGPHFSSVAVDDAPVDAAAVGAWLRCLDVHARARGGGGGGGGGAGEDMVLCGMPGALRDARALVDGHDAPLFGAAEGGTSGCGLGRPGLHAPRQETAEGVAGPAALPGRAMAEAGAAPKAVVMLGGKSGVLSPGTAARLVHALPARFATCNLRLLYSTRVHGISLQSMYAKGAGKSPTILALRDSGGARFGCFASAPWVKAAKPAYYGTGESFCWAARGEDVDVFKWSRKNSYFQCSGAEYFAFGAGGHYAVRMGDDLLRGSSGECETFGSPCLASAGDFSCVVLELWSVEATAFARLGGR